LLRKKPAALVTLYAAIERALAGCDDVEIVAKDRYALFRTTRIFADLVFMRDALRLAVHLKRTVSDPLFFKVVAGRNGQVTHVAKVRTAAELKAVLPFLKEAHRAANDKAR
jgi:predicted transport protein